MKPLLFVGYANVDLIAVVPELPGVGERVTAEPIEVLPGGMAANAACAAASSGAQVFFFGNIGKDDYGKLLLEDFQRYKVHPEYTQVVRSTVCLITVNAEGERTIISEPSSYHPERLRAWLEAYTGLPGYLYIDGYHLCAAKPELELARSKGFSVYCDFDGALDSYAPTEIFQVLPLIDILQITAGLLERLADIGQGLKELQALIPALIVTNGSKEVCLYSQTRRVFPVPETAVVDTTGAGDSFAGSFLASYAASEDLIWAVRQAIQYASEIVGLKGARGQTKP